MELRAVHLDITTTKFSAARISTACRAHVKGSWGVSDWLAKPRDLLHDRSQETAICDTVTFRITLRN